MPDFFRKRWLSFSFLLHTGFSVILLSFLAYYNWALAVSGCIGMIIVIYLLYRNKVKLLNEIDNYITTLSYRVKKVGEKAFTEMPIGIIIYNDDNTIEWTNPYVSSLFDVESLVGESLQNIEETLPKLADGDKAIVELEIREKMFQIHIEKEERLLYLFDITKEAKITQRYLEEKTVLAIVFLDNYEELTQGMGDQKRSSLNSQVTAILNNWANKYNIFLKRVSSERFVAVLNKQILDQLEKTRFDILDEVRGLTSSQNIPFTLSIGVGVGEATLPELGELAQSSLDLALGRGGDQAAIKETSGKVYFYGGKTNPVEKRTRVRARVISHALRDLVLASDNVIVMGHKSPDMDAIGASIGVLKIAEANGVEGYIVVDSNDLDSSVTRLMQMVKQKEELWQRFISPEKALDIKTKNTLLIVVDTHKPSMAIDERLLHEVEKVMVIDHHRRGEEFIEHPVLVYMEPYASSTAELVTELMEYQPKTFKLDMLEATALLAGIIVDTKSFTMRTGSRTFDAASYLRAQGADTVVVQKLLKEDIEQFVRKAKLIENAYIYRNGLAISKASEEEQYSQVLIAQTADTLLTMNGVVASFVISKRADEKVSISARSLGDVNVQLIMESLHGGGHLTNAATQFEDVTIEEAEQQLLQAIDQYLEGGNE